MDSIKKLHVPEKVEEELVVVIDVIRAFTTAAYAFNQGAEKIILVREVEEAFSLKKKHPEYLLMGEVGGIPIDGFDYGNSPFEISKIDLFKKTLVQRTSAGTQGIHRSFKSKKILASSFVCAKATHERIQNIQPRSVTLVITNANQGEEDRALADYLERLLLNKKTDPKPYLQRVIDSREGQALLYSESPYCLKEDLDAILEIDKFSFAMEVFKDRGLAVLFPVFANGTIV